MESKIIFDENGCPIARQNQSKNILYYLKRIKELFKKARKLKLSDIRKNINTSNLNKIMTFIINDPFIQTITIGLMKIIMASLVIIGTFILCIKFNYFYQSKLILTLIASTFLAYLIYPYLPKN